MGRGVVWTGLPLYTEEDVDSSVEWEGYCRLGVESGERLTSDIILLVVQGKENIRYVLEILDGVIRREDLVPNKNNEVQERMELECLEISFCKWCILK